MEPSPDIAQCLGRVEGKVDLLVTGMTQHFADDKQTFAILHKKVDKLTRRWAYAAGGAAVITFLISNFGTFSTLASYLPGK